MAQTAPQPREKKTAGASTTVAAKPRRRATDGRPAASAPSRRSRIVETRILRGPNYWAREPVVRMVVDLGVLEDFPSNKIPGFTDALVELLPSLEDHACSLGRRGGFITRLREGTWAGHITEHIALELQNLAGTDVRHGKTREHRRARPVQRASTSSARRRSGSRPARSPSPSSTTSSPRTTRPSPSTSWPRSSGSSGWPSSRRSGRRPRRSSTRRRAATSRTSGSTATSSSSSARASTSSGSGRR